MKKRIASFFLAVILMIGTVPGFSLIPSAEAATETVILDDDCTSLPDSSSGVKGKYPAYYFAAASNKNGISVPSGTILMGADGSIEESVSLIYSTGSFPSPSFNLEINMKIESLMTANGSPAWRGLRFEVTNPGERLISIAINGLSDPNSDGTNADIYIFKHSKASSSTIHDRITIPTDGAFHTWEIQFDGDSEVRVLIDGKLAVKFEGITVTSPTETTTKNEDGTTTTTAVQPSVRISNTMNSLHSGTNRVLFDNIKLTTGIIMNTLDAAIEPYSSAEKFTVLSELKHLPAGGEIDLTITSKDTGEVFTHTYTPGGLIHSETVTDIPFTGFCTVSVDAGDGVEETFDYYLYADVNTVSPNRTITSDGSLTSYRFERLHNADFANQSAWSVEYFRNGDNTFGSVVSCGAVYSSNPFTVPVTLNGKFAVYVGYMPVTTKRNEFTVNGQNVFITAKKPDETADMNAVSERFAIAGDFSGEKITVSNTLGAACRLVYVRFVSLSDEMYAKYTAYDPSQNLMMDNDGFSFLTNASANTADYLQSMAVDRYANNVNLGQYNFTVWSTTRHNFESQALKKYVTNRFLELGVPQEEIDANNYTDFMGGYTVTWDENGALVLNENGTPVVSEAPYTTLREADYNAQDNTRTLNSLLGAPHQYVANYVTNKNYGDVYVSLRMASFGKIGELGQFSSGTLYQLHPEWVRQPETGEDSAQAYQLSFSNEEYREYMYELLMELASTENAAGITMDFSRYPYLFGGELENVADRTAIMNAFVQRVSQNLPAGKKLNVRLSTPTEIKAEPYGLDYKTWVKNGWVDRVIICEQGHETFFDLAEYADFFNSSVTNPYNVEFYVGIVATMTGHDKTVEEEEAGEQSEARTYVTIEQYMLRAHEAYAAGADGIFLFNATNTLTVEFGDYSPTYESLNNKTLTDKWYTFEYPAYSVSDTVETFVKSWEVPTGFKRLTVRKPPRLRLPPTPA